MSETAEVLRTMASAQHTGKLVLTFPEEGSGTAVVNAADAPVSRADGAYILTGGLGGLGLLLTQYFADGGAGRIVVNARSRPSDHVAEVIAALRSRGADIMVKRGDICQPAIARQLIRPATLTGLPVREIVHAAAVVDDTAIVNIDEPRLDRNWNPKVSGRGTCTTLPQNSLSTGSVLPLGRCAAGLGRFKVPTLPPTAGWTTWRRGGECTACPATAIAWGA